MLSGSLATLKDVFGFTGTVICHPPQTMADTSGTAGHLLKETEERHFGDKIKSIAMMLTKLDKPVSSTILVPAM